MSAPISTVNLPKQLDRTIMKMYLDAMKRKVRYYEPLFKSEDGPKGSDYTQAGLSELGLMREINEGMGVEFDLPSEGNKIARTYKKYGLGTQVTEEMLQDELFDKIKQIPGSLVDSSVEMVEFLAFNTLNNGFSTASSGEDGKALFANNHVTLKGGVTINNLQTGALSSTTLMSAFEYGDGLVGENGFLRPVRPKFLVCHPKLKWVANDLLKSTGRVWDYGSRMEGTVPVSSSAPAGTAMDNQLNPKFGIVDDWKIILSPYITDQDSWFVLFEDYDLRLLWKKRASLESEGDFATGNKMYKSTMRLTSFSNKYKYMVGSTGA